MQLCSAVPCSKPCEAVGHPLPNSRETSLWVTSELGDSYSLRRSSVQVPVNGHIGRSHVLWDRSSGCRNSPAIGRRWSSTTPPCAQMNASEDGEGPNVAALRVPKQWSRPEAAASESQWLRESLHRWLDDEFCPEPPNAEISERCARVYYHCLLEDQREVGDILMQMVRDLETFSFRNSFHGAFSSANAAVHLISKRIASLDL